MDFLLLNEILVIWIILFVFDLDFGINFLRCINV